MACYYQITKLCLVAICTVSATPNFFLAGGGADSDRHFRILNLNPKRFKLKIAV